MASPKMYDPRQTGSKPYESGGSAYSGQYANKPSASGYNDRGLATVDPNNRIKPISSVPMATGYGAGMRTQDNWQNIKTGGPTQGGAGALPGRQTAPGGSDNQDIPLKRNLAQEHKDTMSSLQSITASYQDDINRANAAGGGNGGASPQSPVDTDTWRYGSPSDRGGGGGGGPSGGGVQFNPADAIAKPDRPVFDFEEDYDLPDYSLPDEDMGVFKSAYADATAGYMKEVRNSSMQAIFSARSSQNPNERAMLVEAALSGAGKAYESIGRAGTQAAKSEAGRKRAEQINEYDRQWKAESTELDKKYQAKWQSAIYDFGAEQQEYASDYAAYANQPKDLKSVANKNPLSMGGTTQGYMG